MTDKKKVEAYDKLLIKAKQIYNKENDVLIIHTLEDLFPEFKEFEDERTRKHLISLVKNWDKDGIASKYTSDPNDIKQILAWLEKQGKPIDEEKILIGARKDIALSIMDFLDKNTLGMCLSNKECEDLEDAVVNSDWSKVYNYMRKKLEKQGEQKPVDKVEPKFHWGDCVVDNCGYVWKVEGILNQFYILEGIKGGESRPTTEWVDKTFHLWTIKDAKNGDVLASELCDSIILFRGIKDNNIDFYCDYDFSKIDVSGDRFAINNGQHYGNVEDSKDFHPATKEQRDTLMKAMTDAGWEFNFDKKELKKIITPIFNIGDTIIKKHNSDIHDFGSFTITDITGGKYWYNARIICDITEQDDWKIYKPIKQNSSILSKKDEEYNGEDYGIDGLWHAMNILEKTLGKVDGYQTDDGFLSHQCAITAVKKLYKKKPVEWSEEDERIYQSIIDDTVQENQLDSKQIDWLKSIKSRVQPKQEWSEEDKVRIEQICDDLECGLENFRSRKNVKGLHFEEIIESNIGWLKSLKYRIQPKQEWSEEDERMIDNIIFELEENQENISGVGYKIDWLKSIKDRNLWKPSDEQIEALESATENCAYSEYQNCLRELIGQLKKLKGE